MTSGPTRAASPSPLDEVVSAFTDAWRSGELPRAEQWAARLDPAEVTELIYHEFCLREEDGLDADPSSFLARFPEHRDALSRLFELHALAATDDFRAPSRGVVLPEAGDEIGQYRLVRELGRGTFARVFLAEQVDLDARLVVIKVATRPSPESRLLARARHAHIVEVLSHAVADDGTLHLVCMPFLGGATLAAVNKAGGPRAMHPRSGRDLLARLDLASAPEYPRADLPRPAREILAKISYPRAVAWIFARLAEALDHAHRRGVVHGDIKPTNILLTADALPMLFDFNLAVDWRDGDAADPGGGTLAYMPPERLRMIAAGVPDADGPPDLHRGDLYALGLVLVETLVGASPAVPAKIDRDGGPREAARHLAEARAGGVTAFPEWNRLAIPSGLRPILARSLAAAPADRYEDGRSLAADLDRWRIDLPPIASPDASWPTPLARWLRRRRIPVIAGLITVLAAGAAATYTTAEFRSSRRDQVRAKYARLHDKDDLGLFNFHSFGSFTPRPGGDPAESAVRKLNAFHVLDDPAWRSRDDVRLLDEPERLDVELLMLEQVYRLASAWADRPDSAPDWRRALDLLDREYSRVPARAFVPIRRKLLDALGQGDPESASGRAPSLVEAYLAGVADEPLRARAAFGHYEEAIAIRPDLLWPHYRAASASFRFAGYIDAEKQLRAAIAIRPENPALYTQHATALHWLGQPGEARQEAERALAIEPDFVEAYRTLTFIDEQPSQPNRRQRDRDRFAVLTRHQGRAEADRLDLQSALRRFIGQFREGQPPGQSQDEAGRREILNKVRAVDRVDPDIQVVEANQVARSGRHEEAIAMLDATLRDHPDHFAARFSRATSLWKLARPEAFDEYSAVLEDPRIEEYFRVEPRAIRGFFVLSDALIRRGKIDQALATAERGLEHAEFYRAVQPEALYAVARAHATAAGSDPSHLRRARESLLAAIELLPTFAQWYQKDTFFAGLRESDPTFLADPREHPHH